MLLLLLVIGRVADVHPVVGWKPRVGHTLLGAGSVVMRRHPLSEKSRVGRVRRLLRLLHRLCLLGHLDGSTVVLLVLMRVFDPAISQVRDVRIREVRTHAIVLTLALHSAPPPLSHNLIRRLIIKLVSLILYSGYISLGHSR